jgi:uncharacterized protein (TIGR02246 family)
LNLPTCNGIFLSFLEEPKKSRRLAVLALSQALLMFAFSLVAVSQGGDSSRFQDENRFRLLATEWMEAYNSRDTLRLGAMYAEDADYVSPHVPALILHGRQAIVANFRKGIDAGGHVDAVEILSGNVSSDLAYLVCRYDATNSGKKVSGRNVLVSRKVHGKWLLAVHASVVRD